MKDEGEASEEKQQNTLSNKKETDRI